MMQAQYRNYPQATQRSPHATQTRKGPVPMLPTAHQQVHLTQQQIAQQNALETARRDLSKRIASRPTDKNIPDGVDDIVIGNAVEDYRKLRDVERRLDSVMMRKRLDIQDSTNRRMTRLRTMRIWISNTAENQPWQQSTMDPDAFDFNSENNATYRVKIEGRLLDDDEDDEEESGQKESADPDAMDQDNEGAKQASKPNKPMRQRTKLSHFFKQIVVEFDRSKSLQPDNFTQIEWKKPEKLNDTSSEGNFDCLEFERKGDENVNITINLIRDDNPERYKLSKPLAELLDTDEEERGDVMMAIWNYIKLNNLQEDEDSRKVQCDARLKAVFNSDSIFFPHLPNLITPHLQPLPPLQLPYTIRVDRAYISPQATPGSSEAAPPPSAPTVYDVLVPLPDPLRATYLKVTHNPSFVSTLSSIATHDEYLAQTMRAIAERKAKHAFFSSLSRDPVNFIRRWTSSQKRDMEVLLGEATRGGGEDGQGEAWRRGGKEGVWGSGEARESVGLWLARPKAAH